MSLYEALRTAVNIIDQLSVRGEKLTSEQLDQCLEINEALLKEEREEEHENK